MVVLHASKFLSLWVLSSLTTVSVVPNLSSGFYLRCYLCRTSRFFQFLHCCLCQQSGLVKNLPVIRDFSTNRSLLLSPLRLSGSRTLGAADGNQIVENSRSVCRRLVGLALCLVCNCGKGRDSRRRPLLDNCTLHRPNPAAPTKPTVIPTPGNSKSGSKTISAMNPPGSAKAMTYIQFSVEMYYLAGCQ